MIIWKKISKKIFIFGYRVGALLPRWNVIFEFFFTSSEKKMADFAENYSLIINLRNCKNKITSITSINTNYKTENCVGAFFAKKCSYVAT